MGIYTDILTSARTIDLGGDDGLRIGEQRSVVQALRGLHDRQGDRDYPAGFDAENEVQSIAIHEAGTDGGTYALDFTLFGGVEFSTAALAHDADDEDIQTAIDTAADGVVADYTAGDIAVTGGPLTTDPVVLTYSGASVAGLNHGTVAVDNIDLVDDATPTDAGAVTVTNHGQSKRTAWAILRETGVISDDPPVQGTSAALTRATYPQNNPLYPDQGLIRALAREAAYVDGNADVETEILRAAGIA
jgi:hypothetical protein